MAKKEHWDIDPFDDQAMWLKVVGHPREDTRETWKTGEIIFDESVYLGQRCLEIGAGVGRLLKQGVIENVFDECIGVDSSPSIVAMSTRYLQEWPACRVILSDGLHLPFPDNSFDFVYSFTCFQHMEDLETIRANLREACRVLRPGKLCKVQTVCGQRDSGLYDGYVFESPKEFRDEFLPAGFSVASSHLVDSWIWATATK